MTDEEFKSYVVRWYLTPLVVCFMTIYFQGIVAFIYYVAYGKPMDFVLVCSVLLARLLESYVVDLLHDHKILGEEHDGP
jgi:hypothetical protein